MSAAESLLVFLGKNGSFDRWLRLSGGAVAARGEGVEGLPATIDPQSPDPLKIAAIVPGDEVTLHWLEMPAGLAPLQAAAAARLMAAEFSAQPISEMHVAVGPEVEGDALRCVAIVPAACMAGWIAQCQAAGVDPDMIVPEPLLLLPQEGKILCFEGQGLPVYRGATDAFAIERSLAAVVLAGAAIEPMDAQVFEAGLAESLDRRPVDLRQGVFARRKQWKPDWKLVRRLALLVVAILLVTLMVQVASTLNYTFAADRAEAEANQVAAGALPKGTRVSNTRRQLTQRMVELQGGGASFSETASGLFMAVRATPNVELTAITFDGGGLRAVVVGDIPATISGLEQRIEASGLVVEAGPMRSINSRQTAELTIGRP